MEQDHRIQYLPLGSVVILKGGTQKVIVNARGLVTMVTNPPSFFDYGGSIYPQGIIGDQILYFNHSDIDKVVFQGYSDEDDKLMVKNINEWFEQSDFLRGDARNFKRGEQITGE